MYVQYSTNLHTAKKYSSLEKKIRCYLCVGNCLQIMHVMCYTTSRSINVKVIIANFADDPPSNIRKKHTGRTHFRDQIFCPLLGDLVDFGIVVPALNCTGGGGHAGMTASLTSSLNQNPHHARLHIKYLMTQSLSKGIHCSEKSLK
jgi:hypothetical protein